MTDLFLTLLNMSAAGAVVIGVILAARLALRRFPKKWSYALWSAAAFRLCCPVSLKSAISVFSLRPLQGAQAAGAVGQSGTLTFVPQLLPALPGGEAAALTAEGAVPATVAPSALSVLAILWLAGAAALLCYGVCAYGKVKRLTADAVPQEDNVYETDRIPTPFILGLLRPRIYVPSGLGGERRRCVLLHERFHLRRGDHLVKALAFCLLAIHWFNPLVWLAFRLMGRDMEMRCDEAVLSAAPGGAKEYGAALLSFAAPGRFPAASPLCFGESGAKQRIKNALRWKKPRFWVTLTAAVLCLAVAAACAVNPGRPAAPDDGEEMEHTETDKTPEETVLPFTPGGVRLDACSADPAEGVRIRITVLDNGFAVQGVNVEGLDLTVTLPESWRGLYTYKIFDDDGYVSVYCKSAQEAGAPGRLFTVACVPGFVPLNIDMPGPGSVLAAASDYSVLLHTPSDVQYTEDTAEVYQWMEQLQREEMTVTLSQELAERSYHPGNWPEGTVTIGVYNADATEEAYIICNEETSAAIRDMVERRSFTVSSGAALRIKVITDNMMYYVNYNTGELLLGGTFASPERLTAAELAVIRGAVENAVPKE